MFEVSTSLTSYFRQPAAIQASYEGISLRKKRNSKLIMQVVALAILLLLVSTQLVLATNDGKKQSSIADAVRHYQMVQDAASLFSQNKKDEYVGGFTTNQIDGDGDGDGDGNGDQSDRRLKNCSNKLDKCRTKLDKCEKEADAPTFLFTQMGQSCKLKRKERGDGTPFYEWSSKDLDDETYVFSDRAYRIAYSIPTEEFFENFDDAFSKETGGRPNGAMTFRHKDTNEFEGPLIAVYVDAAYKKSSGKFVYELSQSKDEEEVNALDEFFDDGDVVEYESCSLFIDTAWNKMPQEII